MNLTIPVIYDPTYLKEWDNQDFDIRNAITNAETPKKFFENLNKEILELHPKKAFFKMVADIAITILGIGIGISCCFGSPLNIAFGAYLIILTTLACHINLNAYRQENQKDLEVERKINHLFPRKFDYMDRVSTDANLSPEQFQLVKPYLDPKQITNTSVLLKVRRRFHYELTGGERKWWSLTPLTLKERKKCLTNEKQVSEKYLPWINLILFIKESKQIPEKDKEQIGKALGLMIHKPNDDINTLLAQTPLCEARKSSTDPNPQFFYESFGKNNPVITVRKGSEETAFSNAKQLKIFIENHYSKNNTK